MCYFITLTSSQASLSCRLTTLVLNNLLHGPQSSMLFLLLPGPVPAQYRRAVSLFQPGMSSSRTPVLNTSSSLMICAAPAVLEALGVCYFT